MSTIYDAVTGKPLHPRTIDSVIGPRIGHNSMDNPVTVQLAKPEKVVKTYVPPVVPIAEEVESIGEVELLPQYSDYA